VHVDSTRVVSNVALKLSDQISETTLELDSHTNTSILGRHALITLDYNRPVAVVGYDKALGTRVCQTVSGVVAYTDPRTGRMLHMVINQAIHIPHLDHHLLCSMQCRMNDVIVEQDAQILAPQPTDQMHALTLTNPDNPLQLVILPLDLKGVTSLLCVRNVTPDEYNSRQYSRLHLTSKTLTWDPQTTSFEEQEYAMIDYSGNIVRDDAVRGPNFVISELNSMTIDPYDFTHDCNFHQILESHVVVLSVDRALNGNVISCKTKPINLLTLAARWMISPERAKRTVLRTTQFGVQTCVNPMLARRFLTNDQMLHYNRLPHPVFTDTLIAGTTSKRGKKYAQVYATSFGWAWVHPMTKKSKTHDTLSLMFHWIGVPPTMIFDGSKEQTDGHFKRKLHEANCHAQQTEQYSPWQQATEGCICELKRGVSRKMIKTGSPKALWDHCIELKALIQSSTSNDIYMTNGEVPETIMIGSTTDISHISKFGWYDWVMFRDNIPTFPDDKLILGCYLGQATNVGSTLTAKILKSNGQFICRLTLRHLTDEERNCLVQAETRKAFDASVAEALGSSATVADFPEEDLTPEYDHYDDSILDINPDYATLR
jgi:hypothetical protein